jgi:C4-dicarboxylate-specific signal transduction histidine kinase
MHDVLIDKLNLWKQIGTPNAAREIVPFLWHENSVLASHAALNLGVLLSRKTEIQNALRDYPLTEKQKNADLFEGIFWSLFDETITKSSSLLIIIARMIFLITQELGSLQQKTEKQQAELLHSRQMVTIAKMASSLAHEIMQPLQIILMGADNCIWKVERDKMSKAETINDLQEIVDTTKRIDKIVKKLHIISKKHKPKRELVKINNVIENSLIGFSEQLRSRHITLEKNLADNLPPIQADKIQLEQVFINLIGNARDALEGCDNRHITISTQTQSSNILIKFADNGEGIAPDKLPYIFDPLVTDKEKTGTGMGLYIVSEIIEAYDGKITANSQPNKGTRFLMTFPIAKEETT